MPASWTAWLLNGAYALLLTLLSPIIAWRVLRHGRYRRGLTEKLLGLCDPSTAMEPVVWFHAVSVGEIVQLRKVIDEFRRQAKDRCQIVVSTSTDTGFDLAVRQFTDCRVTWFPLDFSWAVRNAVRRVRPTMVVLMELELWPNFVAECQRRQIPVTVINARISDRSIKGYRRVRRLIAPMLQRLSLVAAQSHEYAGRLRELGARTDTIHITGSVKFDGVPTDRNNPKTRALREALLIQPDETVFVAGSTQAPEEQLALDTWQTLRKDRPDLRLILVPRHKERFDEVAALIRNSGVDLLRRTQSATSCISSVAPRAQTGLPVILLDTIGELGACWGLADIAFVGGSFGARGGQNMIEPAAYGGAVMFGPNTSNFRDVVRAFRNSDACLQFISPEELRPAVERLLNNATERRLLGKRAQEVVVSQQGATAVTASLLWTILSPDQCSDPIVSSPLSTRADAA